MRTSQQNFRTRHVVPVAPLSTDASLGMLPLRGSFFPGWRLVKAAAIADRLIPETKKSAHSGWPRIFSLNRLRLPECGSVRKDHGSRSERLRDLLAQASFDRASSVVSNGS